MEKESAAQGRREAEAYQQLLKIVHKGAPTLQILAQIQTNFSRLPGLATREKRRQRGGGGKQRRPASGLARSSRTPEI